MFSAPRDLERAGALEELALEPGADRAVARASACAASRSPIVSRAREDVVAGRQVTRQPRCRTASKSRTAAAVAAFRLSAVRAAHRDRDLQVGGVTPGAASRPSSSAPIDDRGRPGQVGVGVARRCVDDGGDELVRQRATSSQRRLHDRQREDGAGRCADRVRVPRVGTRRRRRAARRRRRRRRCAPSRRGCRASRSRPRRGPASRSAAARAAGPRRRRARLPARRGRLIFASTRALTSSPPCASREQLRRDVGRATVSPAASARSTSRGPSATNSPVPPPLARLAQPNHLLDARIVDRRDHRGRI